MSMYLRFTNVGASPPFFSCIFHPLVFSNTFSTATNQGTSGDQKAGLSQPTSRAWEGVILWISVLFFFLKRGEQTKSLIAFFSSYFLFFSPLSVFFAELHFKGGSFEFWNTDGMMDGKVTDLDGNSRESAVSWWCSCVCL